MLERQIDKIHALYYRMKEYERTYPKVSNHYHFIGSMTLVLEFRRKLKTSTFCLTKKEMENANELWNQYK